MVYHHNGRVSPVTYWKLGIDAAGAVSNAPKHARDWGEPARTSHQSTIGNH